MRASQAMGPGVVLAEQPSILSAELSELLTCRGGLAPRAPCRQTRDSLGAWAPITLCVRRRSKVVKKNVDGAAGVLGTENNFK